MELNWLQSLVYGLIAGVSEFLPICSESHKLLFARMTGVGDQQSAYSAVARVACLAALLLTCWPRILKMRRESHIASLSPRKRKRQPDINSLSDLRFIKTAAIPMLLVILCRIFLPDWIDNMPAVIIFSVINGILLYIPPYFPAGNKTSQKVSGLDGILVGLGGGLSVLPGISPVAGLTNAGLLRGCDRQYILDIALTLCIPALVLLTILDLIAFAVAGAAVSGMLLLGCLLTALTAFVGAYFGILFLRFLSVKVGFSGFAYYSWGLALFALILYLTI